MGEEKKKKNPYSPHHLIKISARRSASLCWIHGKHSALLVISKSGADWGESDGADGGGKSSCANQTVIKHAGGCRSLALCVCGEGRWEWENRRGTWVSALSSHMLVQLKPLESIGNVGASLLCHNFEWPKTFSLASDADAWCSSNHIWSYLLEKIRNVFVSRSRNK